MPHVLVVHHSPTPTLAALRDQVVAGAQDPEVAGVEVVVRSALEVTADDLLAANGYVLGTSANFGYMSGALKHMFDSTFLAVGGALGDGGGAGGSVGTTSGRPFALYVHGRYDVTGAVRSVLAVTGALGWKQGFSTLEVLGDPGPADLEGAYVLGGTIAALSAG